MKKSLKAAVPLMYTWGSSEPVPTDRYGWIDSLLIPKELGACYSRNRHVYMSPVFALHNTCTGVISGF